MVSAPDAQWRIVFGTADGVHAQWVDIFERPPPFAGIVGGRVVVINGPSSSGKSTLIKELRARASAPWVGFDEPMLGSVDDGYLIWREQSPTLHHGFLAGIAALAKAGNYVAVAAGGHSQTWYDEAFDGVPTLRVGLDCALAELERREGTRHDVQGGLAASSLEVHEGWQYHLRFDTNAAAMGEIAGEVLSAVESLTDRNLV